MNVFPFRKHTNKAHIILQKMKTFTKMLYAAIDLTGSQFLYTDMYPSRVPFDKMRLKPKNEKMEE